MKKKRTPTVVFFIFCILIAAAFLAGRQLRRKSAATPDRQAMAQSTDDWKTYDDAYVRFIYPKGLEVETGEPGKKQYWNIADTKDFVVESFLNALLLTSRNEDRSLESLYSEHKQSKPQKEKISAAKMIRLPHGRCLRYHGRHFIQALCYSSGGKFYEFQAAIPRDPDTDEILKTWTAGRHFERILPTIEFK